MEWLAPCLGDSGGANVRKAQRSSPVVLAPLTSPTDAKHRPRAIGRHGLARRTLSPFSIVFLMILGAVAVTTAQVDDGAKVEPASAREAVMLIQTRCSLCHTADLIVQQRLPEDRWAATVEKMVSWGANLSNDEKMVLLQFLTTQYRPNAPPSLPSVETEAATGGMLQGR